MDNVQRIYTGLGSFILAGGLQVSGYTNPTLAIMLFGLGAIFFLMAWKEELRFLEGLFSVLPLQNGKISLDEAALIAYEELRNTDLGKYVEKAHKDNPILYYAYALSMNTKRYGNHPPSRKLEELPELYSGILHANGKYVGDLHGAADYDNLHITKKRLRSYLREKPHIKF